MGTRVSYGSFVSTRVSTGVFYASAVSTRVSTGVIYASVVSTRVPILGRFSAIKDCRGDG